MTSIQVRIQEKAMWLKRHGREVHDQNLMRTVHELIAATEYIGSTLIEEVKALPLNQKYTPELNDIQAWYDSHFPRYTKPEHRRHIVYFNNEDHDNRLQCISLFQIIGDTMIVHQRSGDLNKMLDDFRFFVEIIARWFPTIQEVYVNYGSLHVAKSNFL